MTYCVGMMLERGLVLMSDTRTNSGVDNFSTFREMFHWSVPGERIIAVMAAGNLATTQTVISRLEERNKAPSNRHNSLLDADTMFHAATIVGRTLKETIALHMRDNSDAHPDTFGASLIVAGVSTARAFGLAVRSAALLYRHGAALLRRQIQRLQPHPRPTSTAR